MGRMSKHGIDLDVYDSRRDWYAARGQELPQTKLLDMDVITIRSAARQRESLRRHIRDNLSNEALARQFGVHIRTIEKVLTRDTHSNLP
jgi:AraC-like DNA-binding protein